MTFLVVLRICIYTYKCMIITFNKLFYKIAELWIFFKESNLTHASIIYTYIYAGIYPGRDE